MKLNYSLTRRRNTQDKTVNPTFLEDEYARTFADLTILRKLFGSFQSPDGACMHQGATSSLSSRDVIINSAQIRVHCESKLTITLQKFKVDFGFALGHGTQHT